MATGENVLWLASKVPAVVHPDYANARETHFVFRTRAAAKLFVLAKNLQRRNNNFRYVGPTRATWGPEQ